MATSNRDPHYFDCPSCKAFATLRLFERKERHKHRHGHAHEDEYVCSKCQGRFDEDVLRGESAKRGAGS
jgi:C4-type Zn-finger protein